ncbi:hypothetical protein JKP88DRAFT_272094 [Tribonema minus]|uniref:oligopeptidase A n=1 Tax=Tribonema minus TaxID=303371 RepID=A0A836CFP0_9STRA|nr:hypothetical protein JKP88DRAFT_272094 [Tribonema minus]
MRKEFEELEATLENPEAGEAWGKKRMKYDYSMVIDRMEQIRAPLEYAWGVVGHLNGVKNSDALREAYQAMQPAVVQAFQAVGQSAAVYAALKFLQKPVGRKDLTEAQCRIIDGAVKQMELSGVGLQGEAKEKFNAIQLELAELSTKFSNNVLDATKAYSLTLTDPADVEGLPPSARAQLAQSAAAAGEEGATPETGPWRVTLDMPAYLPVMQHAKSSALREKLYRAYIARASTGDSSNEPIIKRILTLKRELASLLGFSTYAEVSLASKMADDVAAVDTLSEMLRDKAFPAAQRELEELQKYAASKGHEGALELWDTTYWAERQKEELYAFSEEELRPYFPLPEVLGGMFETARTLFGVSIVPADGETETWHPDVRFFHVNDAASGARIASFYLDPYSRPENKRGGAWMDVCVGRSAVLDRLPVAYLTCNGTPPVADAPSLMTFREVETLFHEFGHGLQHMLTKVPFADAAGINGIEWDAVELPSQFMENFVLEDALVTWRHYQTKEPLPKDLQAKLKAQKTYMAASGILRQLYFGQLDMELHHRYDPAGTESPFDVQKRVAGKYLVVQPLPEDRFLCAFGHIFGGGYAAGYYSYKWAEVMSADAFSAFEEAGLDKPEEIARIGRKFAETVLGQGGGRHPAKVFRDFRGRDPTPDALLRHSGLVAAKL